MGCGAGQRGQVGLKVKARDGIRRVVVAETPLRSGPRAQPLAPGIRPRSSRLATSEVMNTVLPERDRPVTPQADHGLEQGFIHPLGDAFNAAAKRVRDCSNDQKCGPLPLSCIP